MQDLQGSHGSDRKWLFFYREELTRVERINFKKHKKHQGYKEQIDGCKA